MIPSGPAGGDGLEQLVQAALAARPARVRVLDLPDGRRFWLKRVEQLSRRERLQKGNPARAFARELAGIRALTAAGLPVARLVMAGPDWMLLADAGPPLPQVAADPARDEGEKLRAFALAGRALALLHRAGLVHGRPAMRDICWDGKEAWFIDLEQFHPGRQGRWWQAVDVLLLAQTAFTLWPRDPRWVNVTLATYDMHAPQGVMRAARRLAWWLLPLGWLARAMFFLRPQSRELQAVGLTLARLGREAISVRKS